MYTSRKRLVFLPIIYMESLKGGEKYDKQNDRSLRRRSDDVWIGR